MAYDRNIYIPYTVHGGISSRATGTVNTLSGFTNELTTFILIPDTSNSVFNFISNDDMLWDMGDGTIIKGLSAKHVYSFPGVYNVSLVAYGSGGDEYLSTHVVQISASNLFDDSLFLNSTDVTNTVHLPTGVDSAKVYPITLNRHSSLQSYSQLSGTGYTLNLYASGSNSRRLNVNTLNKWSHIDKSWSFYKSITANNGTIQYVPVTTIDTTNEKIYYETGQKFGAQFFRRVSLADVESGVNTSAVFVGTSGSAEVVYGDDSPKYTKHPIWAFITLDTSKFLDQQQLFNLDSPTRYDGNLLQLNFFEHYGLTIPMRIHHRSAKTLTFSSAGIKSIGFDKHKWQSTQIPFFINLVDAAGEYTKGYPTLSAFQAVKGTASLTDTYITNISAVSGSTTTKLLSANFYRQDDGKIPSDLEGTFRGYFIPYDTGDDLSLEGSMVVNDPPNFAKDIYLGILGNHYHNKISCMFLSEEYGLNGSTGTVQTNQSVGFTPIDIPASGPIFSSAIVPESTRYTDTRVVGLVIGAKNDTLSAIDSRSSSVSAICLPKVRDRVNSNASLEPITNMSHINTYGNGTQTSFDPVHVAFDSNKSAWVACSGAAVLLKLDLSSDVNPVNNTQVGTLDHAITIPENIFYDTTTTDGSSISIVPNNTGQYGLLTVGLSEPDQEDNVWVAFTNPISSFISKYNTATSITTKLSSYYLTPQGLTLTDMNATNQNDLWVCAANNELSHLSQTMMVAQTVSGLSADGNNLKYEFASMLDTDTQAVTFSVGKLISLSGFSNEYYNGKFIINAVSDKVITVNPYTGRMNNLGTAVLSESNIVATINDSDYAYKIDKYGNTLYSVSGMFNPQYLVNDKYQGVWVAHDINTLTQVNTAGQIVKSITVQDSTFTNMFVSAASTYSYTATAHNMHIGGISFDTYDNLLVINSYENKIYVIPTYAPTLSASYNIATTTPIGHGTRPEWIFGRHQAIGDWTGYKWQNKYINTTGIRTITGSVPFTVLPSDGKYSIRKINENFDPIETIKEYRTQPILIDKGKQLFDNFYGTIVGTVSTDPSDIGRTIYEKIANFTDNTADINTCNINALYSLCRQYGVNIKNFNFTYPAGLSRIMNLCSIPHKKLWGSRNRFARDFYTYGLKDSRYGKNLGTEISVGTYTVSAGTSIVACQLFNNNYTLVNTPYITGSNTDPGYDSTVGMLSSYPLSSYAASWGWKLGDGVDSTNVGTYFKFYNYIEYYNDTLVEGIVDWNNPYTSISENVSAVSDWTDNNGFVETSIDYEIRKGLNLFTTYSAANTNVL